MSFEGKVALVTGASSGIGEAIALAFAARGAAVVVNGRDPDRIERVVGRIKAAEGAAIGVRADVASRSEVQRLVESALSAFGRIDILVNNAGGDGGAKRVEDISEQEWDAVFATNLKSVFLVTQAVLPVLKRQGGGKIVNISSQAGRAMTILAGPAYSAAKAGVQAFSRQVAREAAPFGINVNVVAPGIIRSSSRLDAVWDDLPDDLRARILSDIPAGRLGENAEIVAAALFLASPDASYLIGATLDVNGGRWML
ncbi:3-oxoacyl-[acyl-carrier protein] reductase [Rhodoblastus acidophilus]|uniref:3-oxoacyl-[acyl-carrier protein] reductase n=1 Tax=Rhodoblastus acidophilus TaxID=1074 RepID=A0A212SA31_RHOAC|nr:SDR family NAD(P)-dependent oxidoreductase [Rhodoblastus acidophilus]PPQ36070.1 NAD(P)-dependent oxidoreductase [Rhodoblastus acidophilus]RAI18783.1 NAD(P)-dependent oxidoreductase [Rhodoblastus acidophilus]SNB82130.1 3-oxoacyl-[acyl-carrier protein] reductase [Rhodoblastus acidophilus]